jgi:hypothetical protein
MYPNVKAKINGAIAVWVVSCHQRDATTHTARLQKGSTICPMSEIVCFSVLNFTYSRVENTQFFALDLAVSLVLEFTFQTYQLVYYNLFVFVSSIAKISSSFLSLVLLNNILVEIMS